MDDIVNTLQMKAIEARYWGEDTVVALTLEEADKAAAEIERLRYELGEANNTCEEVDADNVRLRTLYAAAWAECEGWRQWDDVDPQIKGECLREARERRIATDAARKESE